MSYISKKTFKMTTKLKLVFTLLLIICFSLTVNAQDKVEREFAITPAVVPTNALKAMNEVPNSRTFKWYKELSGDKISYEAKGTWQRKPASIEFDKNGVLEDIEITEKKRAIPDNINDQIISTLDATSSRFKIKKIQFQYNNTGEPMAIILEQISNKQLAPFYELIVSLKIDGAYERFEYLFDSTGNFVKRFRLVERNDFNIQF